MRELVGKTRKGRKQDQRDNVCQGDIYIYIYIYIQRERERVRERETDRETERDRERATEHNLL